MITYTDGIRAVAIIDATGGRWSAGVFDSFSDFVAGSAPVEVREFVGTPNLVDLFREWPGLQRVVRDPVTLEVMPNAECDLPYLSAVPPRVSARQLRLWLVRHGIALAAVDAAIAAIPDAQQREECRVEWDYAPYVERSHPMLVPLAAALGLTEAQVDDAFREAAGI